jgi:haloalkane dehalogenase
MEAHDTIPQWLDKQEYPFTPYYYDTSAGRMFYIDEGKGDVLLFLHGNPAWSFTYRKLIKKLSGSYRCIAVDYIGFGLSDKPEGWTYLPKDHAAYIETFIKYLQLKNITLVLNDWGGPIGMHYAVAHPDNIKSLVIFNTWAWSVKGNKYYEQFSGFMGGPVGRFLIRQFNLFGKSVVSMATGNKKNFPVRIHKMYYRHLATPADRKGSYTFPKEIIGSSVWLADIWAKRHPLQHKPALLLWGMKDIAFRKDILQVWEDFFDNKQVVTFPDAGHFPQEERGEECAERIREFMGGIA